MGEKTICIGCVLVIRSHLFLNQLEGLESALKKQDEEIAKLKTTHVSALATRDLARQNQHRKEISLLSG